MGGCTSKFSLYKTKSIQPSYHNASLFSRDHTHRTERKPTKAELRILSLSHSSKKSHSMTSSTKKEKTRCRRKLPGGSRRFLQAGTHHKTKFDQQTRLGREGRRGRGMKRTGHLLETGFTVLLFVEDFTLIKKKKGKLGE